MQLIRIAGPTEAMRRLQEVEGLDFERTSASRLDDDTWQVSGYATDEALSELEARGLSTELVVPADKVEEDRQALYAAISADPEAYSPDDDPPASPAGDAPAGGDA
jgi:hypothetical protein